VVAVQLNGNRSHKELTKIKATVIRADLCASVQASVRQQTIEVK
jgi:hypothetical protein